MNVEAIRKARLKVVAEMMHGAVEVTSTARCDRPAVRSSPYAPIPTPPSRAIIRSRSAPTWWKARA